MKLVQHFSQKRNVTIFFCALTVSGCATQLPVTAPVAYEQNLIKASNLPSLTTIEQLENRYQQFKLQQLDFYAPNHFKLAGEALEDAKLLLTFDDAQQDITNKITIGEAMLTNGSLVMRRVKQKLSEELILKNELETLQANEIYPEEHAALTTRMSALIAEIEVGKVADNINERQQLLTDMMSLKQRTLYHRAMAQPQQIFANITTQGAEQLIPITYKETKAVLDEAHNTILQNPNDQQLISSAGSTALFAAKRAKAIFQAVVAYAENAQFSREQMILEEEARLARIAQNLTSEDFRDNTLDIQANEIANVALEKVIALKNRDELVVAIRDTLINVRDSSNRLSMVSEAAENLHQEKSEWLSKEDRYRGTIDELKHKLSKTKEQLYDTQNTIVDITTENVDLNALIEMKISESKDLQTIVQQTKQENEKNKKIIAELLEEIALSNQEKQSQQAQISSLQEKLKTANTDLETLKSQAAGKQTTETDQVVNSKPNKPKVTHEEVLGALESAKELINSLASKNNTTSAIERVQNNSTLLTAEN